MLAADEAVMSYVPVAIPEIVVAAAFAAFVLVAGWALNRMHGKKAEAPEDAGT